jgi:hypothetical protein
MPFRFFTVPVNSPAESAAELNAFLASHKVLAVYGRGRPTGAPGGSTFRGQSSAPRHSSPVNPAIARCLWRLSPASGAARSGGSRWSTPATLA